VPCSAVFMSLVVRRKFPGSCNNTAISAESQTGYIFKLSVADNEKSCLVATQDRCLRHIDLESFSMISQIVPAHESTITDIQAVPGSDTMWISASNDGLCKVWDMRQSDPVVSIKVSNNVSDAPVFAASVSTSGTCAVACGTEIHLFKFGEWKRYFTYTESHFDTISCMQFSRLPGKADILVSGADDGMVNIYNTTDLVNEDNGQCPVMTFNTEESVRSVLFSSDENLFAFSTTESVSVWDPRTGGRFCPKIDEIRTNPLLSSEETGWAYIVGMDPSGSRLIAGNSEGNLVELEVSSTPKMTRIFDKAHSGVVRSCAYLHNGLVLTAGEDGYLYEWSVPVMTENSSIMEGRSKSARSSVSSRPY
jgi:WD40 repeat protein